MDGGGIHEFTVSGNMRGPPRKTLVDWILASWENLDKQLTICKIYATKLIIQLTIQRRMTYLHNITYISFLTIILPTNLTLQCVDLLFFIVVLPGVTYNVTF